MITGFVDVTGWSAREVARLGHADDHTPEEFRPRRGAVRVTAGGGHPGFASADVWAAACAAQRINGEYVKTEQWTTNPENGQVTLSKPRNRDIMKEFLDNPDGLLPEDISAGEQCRTFLRNDLTFRALKGQLTEFDSAVSKVLAVEDRFFPQQHKYELAVIACLPQSHARSEARQQAQSRMKMATGGLIATEGAKVAMTVEVVSATYSQNYGIFWINAVNDADQPVTFSYRSQLTPGAKVSIVGTVKGYRDNRTQLNRVKIV